MVVEYFSMEHETSQVLSQFPTLVQFSHDHEYGLDDSDVPEDEILFDTLKRKKFSDKEIRVILRQLYQEVDRALQ